MTNSKKGDAMGIDLGVDIPAAVPLEDFIHGVQQVLERLTNQSPPPILLNRMDKGILYQDNLPPIGSARESYYLTFTDFQDWVRVGVVPLSEIPDSLPSEKHLMFCCIGVTGGRDASELVLMLACAIYLAERFDTVIEDNWNYWIIGEDPVTPEKIIHSLNIPPKGIPFSKACQLVVQSRSHHEPEWWDSPPHETS